jgi:hypothetical protein
MGNPKGVTTGPPSTIDSGNGIFAQVPGECISAGAQTLPPPATMPRQTVIVETDGGHMGRVVITYVSEELRYRRDRRWVWLARRVDPAPPGAP